MKEYKVKVYSTRTEWYNLDGKRHRENGPAFEYTNGSKAWYINGKLHRTDGPAIEFANGNKSWHINDKYYTETEFNEYINKQNKPCLGKKVIVDGVEYELR